MHLNRLIAWLQRHLKTDVRYLTKGGFWVSVAFGVEVLCGVLVTVYLANVLTKESLGTYQYILATAAILSLFTLSGIKTALIRGVARGNAGLLKHAILTKLKWNIGIALGAGVIAAYYYLMGNELLAGCFLIVGVSSPLIESLALYQPFLVGLEAFRFRALTATIRRAIPAITMLVVATYTTDVFTIVATYFFINLLSVTTALIATTLQFRYKATEDKEMVGYSKHLSVMNMLVHASNQADKLILWHFLGPASVATFTIAQLPTRYTGNSITMLRSLFFSRLAKRDFPTLKQTLPRKVRIFSVVIVGLVSGYILIAPALFGWLLPDYQDAVLISQTLSLTILFLPRIILQQALAAHAKKRALYIINGIVASVKIISLLLFVPVFGIWGAVFALIATEAISAAIGSILFIRTT